MTNNDPNYLKDLKAILYSKRANIYYLEKCRIMVKDGRVVYLTQVKYKYFYYNIPIANTTVLLLGTGTSIPQAAVRYLASAGVMIGFTGSNGTPLFAGTEIEFLSSKNEYRPTEYLQNWVSLWALGIPPAFALFPGKTRRGGLVFDVANLIKDAIVLPLSFCSTKYNFEDELFRSECLKYFTDYKVLDYMFDSIKFISQKYSKVN